MTDINFIELAEYCQRRYKEEKNSDNKKYISTLFVAITKEGEIIPSTTPHILKDAELCILLHRSTYKNNNYWWDSLQFEFINSNGVILDRFDDKFKLVAGSYNVKENRLELSLKYKENSIYSFSENWENSIIKVWKLYLMLKDIKTYEEIKLITDLYQKDEKILELENQIEDFKFSNYLLEQERNQYKSLLDEIKQIVG
ncbi:MAG: hypothetical protein IKY79_01230 [Bacteroidales bacterium]|nr:hypothetical protein [Bacteroidales bacterium]